ncbi:MAG: P-loop containing nucleoside triphosphate hydrolase protein [Monoraphidium minutum]|nr:MAG: P-loop containing nucleoside triphosphate hydrolase protein [Monoraphidium minutum]
MASFLSFGKSFAAETSPGAPTIRVVVVGDQNAGKTALSELIVTRKASQPSKSTAGCAVSVALWEVDDGEAPSGGGALSSWDSAKGALQGGGKDRQKVFVEIWDVSANPYYEQLRRTLYKQVNGVILVWDSTDKSSLRRLTKWATEVAADGTFVAPFPDDTAARRAEGGEPFEGNDASGVGEPPAATPNIGGLPVPVLIVANKCDRQRSAASGGGAGGGALDALVARLCGPPGGGAAGAGAGLGARGGELARACAAALGCRWQRGGGGGGSAGGGAPGGLPRGGASAVSLAELEGQIRSVAASAATGQLDWAAVGAFFTALWARRFQPNTRSSARFLQQVPAAGGGGGGAPPPLFSPAGPSAMHRRLGEEDEGGGGGGRRSVLDEDRRVDDDWV